MKNRKATKSKTKNPEVLLKKNVKRENLKKNDKSGGNPAKERNKKKKTSCL